LRAAGALYPQIIFYGGHETQSQWYDPFNPVARKIYWHQMSKEIFAHGFDGWWLDASEPELNVKWGEFREYPTGAGPGAKVLNAYPLMHTSGVYAGQRAENSDKRVFILTRSAYAGQQRNSAVTWSGDIKGNWDVFAKQIPAGLNFCASGIPYWNTDTGGFFGGDPANAAYTELFTRWFQFSAFCPMFRVHGTGKPKEIWRFDEATQKILIEYDQLRYHLLPYIYSLSWKVTSEGYTMMRPLVMDFRSDAKVFNIGDQFLMGPALMACPVTVSNATTRSVYLPTGTAWIDFWTGKTYSGGQTIDAAAPIETLPLFVRAGSILPYGPAIEYAMESNDPMELRIYRGANGTFTLYEDEGDNYNYEKGAHATIPISWDESAQSLTIGKRSGKFSGMLKKRTFRIVWVSPDYGVGVESTASPEAVVTYDGSALKIAAPRR
jgi:alpha-D-xyloside xylohydrolase